MEEGFDFTPKRMKQEGELEVTGVSRSGRVRKKSSKLTDFESLDEIDTVRGTVKKKEKDASPSFGRSGIKKDRIPTKEEAMLSDDDFMESPNFIVKTEAYTDESEQEAGSYGAIMESSGGSIGSDIDDIDDGDMEQEEVEGFQPIGTDPHDDVPNQVQSLYMMEKSSKKKLVIKDGKIVGRAKAQRKDKGKTRISAYTLWAKEIRQELLRSNPDLDFSQTSKRLGELWATIPIHEKYIWKRRAKREALKLAAQPNHQPLTIQVEGNKKVKSPPNKKLPAKPVQFVQNVTPEKNVIKPSDAGVFKPVSTTPLDVAAHLKLLGESLAIIGERLTQHEGHIKGSFSVLLDSLVCCLGPLMCLTQQVPELNVIPQEQLSQLLDNIAYIMPAGL